MNKESEKSPESIFTLKDFEDLFYLHIQPPAFAILHMGYRM